MGCIIENHIGLLGVLLRFYNYNFTSHGQYQVRSLFKKSHITRNSQFHPILIQEKHHIANNIPLSNLIKFQNQAFLIQRIHTD